MYLLIPFILIFASIGAIIFIVWRKLAGLMKFAESEISITSFSIKKDWKALFYDFCPEILSWLKNIKFEEYKEIWLIELEKALRRLRVVSLRMDRFSGVLIKKIRKQTSVSTNLNYQKKNDNDLPVVKSNDQEDFKKTESRLIIEIAKNPKNSNLYEELGDLYSKMGDHQDAKESYEAAIELSPQNEELKKKLSSALEKINTPTSSQN